MLHSRQVAPTATRREIKPFSAFEAEMHFGLKDHPTGFSWDEGLSGSFGSQHQLLRSPLRVPHNPMQLQATHDTPPNLNPHVMAGASSTTTGLVCGLSPGTSPGYLRGWWAPKIPPRPGEPYGDDASSHVHGPACFGNARQCAPPPATALPFEPMRLPGGPVVEGGPA
jgi:hypothetical protein